MQVEPNIASKAYHLKSILLLEPEKIAASMAFGNLLLYFEAIKLKINLPVFCSLDLYIFEHVRNFNYLTIWNFYP